jgi:hypothetical protein
MEFAQEVSSADQLTSSITAVDAHVSLMLFLRRLDRHWLRLTGMVVGSQVQSLMSLKLEGSVG